MRVKDLLRKKQKLKIFKERKQRDLLIYLLPQVANVFDNIRRDIL